ncbi:MAG: MOSC domain-containing protein [Flavobacteriales bacterium]|nr:MOSC domain-containing protein [Flavobacteriales bacterium]
MSLASIHIYPIKSLGGFTLNEARMTDRGFAHDRRWMLVDADGRFISQREVFAMACLHCAPSPNGFTVTDVRDGDRIDLPWAVDAGESKRVLVWSDAVEVLHAPMAVSAWFAEKLGITCSLVFMPDAAHRPVDAKYASGGTSLSDGFPYLIVSQASLDDLNTRLESPVPMNRFRPNLVIAGGAPFQEDAWTSIAIGAARFSLVKPCARCVITTTDQLTGERGKEPLRTLASYRSVNGKVMFGMNAMGITGDMVRVGDLVTP